MDTRLKRVFGQYLRCLDDGALVSSDGRGLAARSPALETAKDLIDLSADMNADEIIKLMKPYCRPFDVSKVKRRLQDMGAKQKAARAGRLGKQGAAEVHRFQQRSAN